MLNTICNLYLTFPADYIDSQNRSSCNSSFFRLQIVFSRAEAIVFVSEGK